MDDNKSNSNFGLPGGFDLGGIGFRVESAFADINRSIADATRGLRENWQQIQEQMSGLGELLAEAGQVIAENWEDYKVTMLEYGYPPHYNITPGRMKSINDCHKTRSREQTARFIEKCLLNDFDDHYVGEMTKYWQEHDFLRHRSPILAEAADNYLCGNYHSAICTLLPQIEGLIVEQSGVTGRVNQKKLQQIAESTLSDRAGMTLDEAILKFYTSQIRGEFGWGSPVDSQLNRNAILHGGIVNYGTKINALRCILLFDYLVDKFIPGMAGRGTAEST